MSLLMINLSLLVLVTKKLQSMKYFMKVCYFSLFDLVLEYQVCMQQFHVRPG